MADHGLCTECSEIRWKCQDELVELRNSRDEGQRRERSLISENERLREALEFYADPGTYHAISFMCDPPGGGWVEDFDDDHGDDGYNRPMPGKTARAALEGK